MKQGVVQRVNAFYLDNQVKEILKTVTSHCACFALLVTRYNADELVSKSRLKFCFEKRFFEGIEDDSHGLLDVLLS